jgi:hypothetical protein
MNEVESNRFTEAVPRYSENITSLNSTDSFNNTDSDVIATTELVTTNPDLTAIDNLTVIDTMLKTAITMENMKIPSEEVDHPYYIYIWTIGIVGCIIFTTWRYELLLFCQNKLWRFNALIVSCLNVSRIYSNFYLTTG